MAPRLLSFVASDDMSATDGPAPGDLMRLQFDMATDTPGGDWREMFTFEPPLAADIGGGWRDTSTFQFSVGASGGGTIGNGPGAPPALAVGVTTLRVTGGTLRSARERDEEQTTGRATPTALYNAPQAMVLDGSFGTFEPPRLVGFVPYDPVNADTTFGDGDKLELTFDVFTSEGGAKESKKDVDGIFAFSTSLGTDYSGVWSDCIDPEVRHRGTGTRMMRHATLRHAPRAALRMTHQAPFMTHHAPRTMHRARSLPSRSPSMRRRCTAAPS